jgi:nitrite reductase (NO-forming)
MNATERKSEIRLIAISLILMLGFIVGGWLGASALTARTMRSMAAAQETATPPADAADHTAAVDHTAGAQSSGAQQGAAQPSGTTGQAIPVRQGGPAADVSLVPDVSFTLRTEVGHEGLYYVGVGGVIDGQINPTLQVAEGAVVQVTLVNGDGALHDIVFAEFGAATEQFAGRDSSSTTVFKASQPGEFEYFCSVPGHRQAGMVGKLLVGDVVEAPEATGADIVADPADLPASVGARGPQSVRLDLETVELKGQLADGTTYNYWTFNSQVPGPMLRVRVGDSVEVHLSNKADSKMIHSIDFHAATGPGGGAAVTQVPPGEERSFTFKALSPGVYVYHCATPMVAAHISNGMYGLIVVEPEGGLPPVDREFYVMQGELYTQQAYGQHGDLTFNVDKLLAEQAEYVTFNGAVGALTTQKPLQANVGETVRIFFGVGGPNYTSSFHVIGEIFDRVYDQASITAPPLTDVQTTLVPAGGATMVEFKVDVPGRYVLVDHALSRMERGLVGFLNVEGPENPEIFSSPDEPSADSGH